MSVSSKGQRKLTTQCYVKGEPRNKMDFILKKIKDSKARDSLIVPFKPMKGSKLGELTARFDIVLGWTPQDWSLGYSIKSYTRTFSIKGSRISFFAFWCLGWSKYCFKASSFWIWIKIPTSKLSSTILRSLITTLPAWASKTPGIDWKLWVIVMIFSIFSLFLGSFSQQSTTWLSFFWF